MADANKKAEDELEEFIKNNNPEDDLDTLLEQGEKDLTRKREEVKADIDDFWAT